MFDFFLAEPETWFELHLESSVKIKLLTIVVALIAVSTPFWYDVSSNEQVEIPSAIKPTLVVGELAPQLEIAGWISNGNEMLLSGRSFEPGRVYVLQFLTSWSATCDQALLECDRLQQKYGDQMQVIALSPEPRESFDTFVDTPFQNEPTRTYRDVVSSYGLASDQGQSVYNQYMKATLQTELPMAFVVGKTGRLEWFGKGHEVDQIVQQVIAGTWDSAGPEGVESDIEQRRQIAMRHRIRKIQMEQGYEAALNHLDEILDGEKSSEARNYLMATRHDIVMGLGGRLPILELRQFAKNHQDQPELLNEQAWQIAIRAPLETIPEELLQVAVETARLAEKANSESHHIQDTLARLYEIEGNWDQAIRAAENAVRLSGDDPHYIERLNQLKSRRK